MISMIVGVGRLLDGGVTEQVGHELHMSAGSNAQRRKRVPQRVQRDVNCDAGNLTVRTRSRFANVHGRSI